MTNQRFTETLSTGIVTDNFTGKEYKCEMRIDDDLLKLLNELHEENQELKQQLQNTSDQRDEFHHGARENANRVGKLEKENEQLKKAIVETEKMVQSTYDELTKLRCFKKNILRIKHSWDYLMEAIQYD